MMDTHMEEYSSYPLLTIVLSFLKGVAKLHNLLDEGFECSKVSLGCVG
jgi:hypothetical protein